MMLEDINKDRLKYVVLRTRSSTCIPKPWSRYSGAERSPSGAGRSPSGAELTFSMTRFLALLIIFITGICKPYAQILPLDTILARIEKNNVGLQGYAYKMKSLDAFARGAKSWDAPLAGTGPYMTPYKYQSNPGMGTWMISVQQMVPNAAKQRAKEKYMQAMSAVEAENSLAARNELFSMAKEIYYEWVILKKKQRILEEKKQLL